MALDSVATLNNIITQNMKFEKQRTTHSLSNKIELSNPDYLTFRNNPGIENTGRTVYSQQFDYRSVEKYTSDEET